MVEPGGAATLVWQSELHFENFAAVEKSEGSMPQTRFVYLGIHGAVIALNSANGEQLWSRSLRGTDFVNVVLDGSNLYAATHGEIYCLDPRTGIIRWHNPLKGYGWGLVSIATESACANATTAQAQEIRRRQEQAAASA